MAREPGHFNWYDNTERMRLARSMPADEGIPARELDAYGGFTNQRLLAPPGDVRGIEHDPETSRRLVRHPTSPNPVGERRNRERPVAQQDSGMSRPLAQRDPKANDGNEDHDTERLPDETRGPGEDDVSEEVESVGTFTDQYKPKRGTNMSWYGAPHRYQGMRPATRPTNVGGRSRPVATASRGARTTERVAQVVKQRSDTQGA